ncbi:class I SAM-dependent methyltransferase [Streptomyces sp. O3]
MRTVDYNTQQHQDYARGRALTERQLQAWISAFAAALPERRPLAGLDVGSGTGRFAPALAETFGPVVGVEPADRMREVAQAQSRHPDVRYIAGAAEEIPVPSESADYALLAWSWHHVQDQPRAARELARVLRPGGRLRLRTLSLFAQLSPAELEEGLRRVEQAVAADPDAPAPELAEPLLTLELR